MDDYRLAALRKAVRRDDDSLDRVVRGGVIHQIHENILNYGAQSSRSRFFFYGFVGYRLEAVFLKGELNAVEREKLGILLDNRVFGWIFWRKIGEDKKSLYL